VSPVLVGPRANRRVTCSTLPADRSESVLVANPNDPLHMVGASKRFFDLLEYRFTLATYVTFDGGLSWREAPPIQLPGWDGASDPALAWDDAGNVFLVALPFVGQGNVVGIAVYKSTDGGRTWGAPRLIHESHNDDKQWAAGDTNPASPHHGNVYAVWKDRGLAFARTRDHGATWKGVGDRDADAAIGGEEAFDFEDPELSVAPDGSLYIVYFDGGQSIKFLKSTDGGASFAASAVIASPITKVPSELPGGRFRVIIAPTGCAGPGDLVVFAWSDFRDGVARLYYRRSTDGGATWLGSAAGDPLLAASVPSDPDQHDFFPQIGCTPRGEIGCAFYELGPKAPGGPPLIHVVLAASTDGGATFPHRVTVTDRPWDPRVAEVFPKRREFPNSTFIGDYFGLEATRLGFFPFWTDTRTGVQEIFTARVAVNPTDLVLRDRAADTGDPATTPQPPQPDAAWEAPDLVVRRQEDGATPFEHQDLLADGRDHFIYARVRNRGDNPAENAQLSVVVATYPPLAGLPGAEFRYPQDWYANDWDTPALRARHKDLGLSPAKTVAPGATEVLGPVAWRAADLPPRSAFPCLLAEVRADNDDSAGGPSGGDLQADPNPCRAGAFFWGNDNVCQRNLRFAPTVGLLIRDAVDDDGTPGAVAWGGRSPDIVVAGGGINPPVAFTDLADPAPGDLLSSGENRLFVRVHNRGATRESAAVDLYFAPADAPWTWPDLAHRIAAAAPVRDIDPGSFGYTAEILWTPSPGPPGYVLVALARPSDAPLPDLPGTGAPPDLADFWSWFLAGGPGRSAGMRAVRFAS